MNKARPAPMEALRSPTIPGHDIRPNGWVIVAALATEGGGGTRWGAYILAEEQRLDPPRFVTAWLGRDGDVWDDNWSVGHYFDGGSLVIDDRRDAIEDFAERCKRG